MGALGQNGGGKPGDGVVHDGTAPGLRDRKRLHGGRLDLSTDQEEAHRPDGDDQAGEGENHQDAAGQVLVGQPLEDEA